MSIIADTLQRLQTQTSREHSDTREPPAVVIPGRGKREPGWHTPPSRSTLWVAGLGMTLGLSGLGVVMYWIGFHLDFGMSTYASPKASPDLSLKASPPMPDALPEDLFSAGSIQIPTASPLPEEPTSTSAISAVDEGTILDDARSRISSSSTVEQPLSKPPVNETPISSETAASPRSVRPRLPPLDTKPAKISGTYQLIQESAAPHGAPLPPSASSTQSPLHTPLATEAEAVHEAEDANPKPPAEDESLSGPNLSVISHPAMGDTSFPSETTVMIPTHKPSAQTARIPEAVHRSPSDRLFHAQQLIQTGKYQEARVVLSPLFTNPPVNWEPWFWLGTAYLGENDLEQADQCFLSGLARNDKIPQLWVQRALVAQQQGNYQLAVYELRHAESLQPDLPHIHLNMGYAYEHLGNDRLAHQYFRKFLQLSEGNPDFFSTRKKILTRLTMMNGAVTQPQESH